VPNPCLMATTAARRRMARMFGIRVLSSWIVSDCRGVVFSSPPPLLSIVALDPCVAAPLSLSAFPLLAWAKGVCRR
jgi:hypothetical protein